MYYVYILQSKKDLSLYIGFTTNLEKRIEQHNNGLSKSTKLKAPYELIYYEAFKDEELARKREKNLKYFGKAYGQLKNRIGL